MYYVELVNELVFTFMLDLCPLFSELIISDNLRYELGWIFIILYIGMFLFNLGVILMPVVSAAKKKCLIKLKARAATRLVEAKAKAIQKEKKVKI